MAKILFLHGLESSPTSSKVQFLIGRGHEVIAPALPKGSWSESLSIAQSAVEELTPDIIVGSSRGGALAMNINPGRAKLILIAPAYKKYGNAQHIPAGTVIVHSPLDEVIPFDDSVELAMGSGVMLVAGGKSHRMSDPEALAKINAAI
jgi:hypothetical protein